MAGFSGPHLPASRWLVSVEPTCGEPAWRAVPSLLVPLSSVRPPLSETAAFSTARQLVDTVSVPRLVLVVEREAGRPTSRSSPEIVIDGDTCRIGAHSTNDV